MSYLTLPVTPSYSSSFTYTARVRQNNFSKGGFAQTVPDGINNIVRGLNLEWSAISLAQKQALCENFFQLIGSSTPFYYTPYGSSTSLLWKCTGWNVMPLSANYFRVTAKILQSFDLTVG